MHDLPPPPVAELDDESRFGAGSRMEAATTAVNSYVPASYQGLSLHAYGFTGPVLLSVHASVYRLDHMTGVQRGPGDIELAAWTALLRRRAILVGAGLPVTLPTGDANRGLGMGHPMLLPSVYASMRRGRLDTIVVASYHHAIDAEGHKLYGIHGPVINPMTTRELAGSARGTIWLAPDVGAVGELGAAIPLDDEPTRAAVGVGARLRRRSFDVNAIVQLALAGDPFGTRGVLELRLNR